jgi:hypothetical protein
MNYFITTNQESVQELRKRKNEVHEERGATGTSTGDKCLEVIEATDEVLHVAGH